MRRRRILAEVAGSAGDERWVEGHEPADVVEKRRAEIVEDFDREFMGACPRMCGGEWEVVKTTKEKVGDVAANTKQLVGHVDNSLIR